MRIHRFILNVDLVPGELVIEDGAIVHQIRAVFRMRDGDEIIISDGHGREARAQIVSVNPKWVQVDLVEIGMPDHDPHIQTVLYLAVLKRENFELALQKATECGLSEIVPMITSRTVKLGVKTPRLKTIAREASEQSGRARVPAIRNALTFAEALEDAKVNDANLFFDARGKTMHEVMPKMKSKKRIGLFIGPEGGWDPEEFANAAAQPHLEFASLGLLTLRAETAAAIATYLTTHI